VEVPDPPRTLVGVNVHDRFVELVVKIRATVPANPFNDETETVEIPVTPALSVNVEGARIMVKSRTWKVTVAECDKVPFVPMIVAR
jgi:hypothetical protein